MCRKASRIRQCPWQIKDIPESWQMFSNSPRWEGKGGPMFSEREGTGTKWTKWASQLWRAEGKHAGILLYRREDRHSRWEELAENSFIPWSYVEGEDDNVVWVNALMEMMLSVLGVDWRETEVARGEAIAGKQKPQQTRIIRWTARRTLLGLRQQWWGWRDTQVFKNYLNVK